MSQNIQCPICKFFEQSPLDHWALEIDYSCIPPLSLWRGGRGVRSFRRGGRPGGEVPAPAKPFPPLWSSSKMGRYTLPFLNTLTLLLTLAVNYLNVAGLIGGIPVGEMSDRYPTLVTPAGYAFSIWGLIYLLLLAFVGYQWYLVAKEKDTTPIRQTGIWLIVANLLNAAWILAWTNDYTGLSVLVMLGLLSTLVVLAVRLRLELWDAPFKTIALVWWPITIYLGWIVVATVANVSAWLVSTGWEGGPLSPRCLGLYPHSGGDGHLSGPDRRSQYARSGRRRHVGPHCAGLQTMGRPPDSSLCGSRRYGCIIHRYGYPRLEKPQDPAGSAGNDVKIWKWEDLKIGGSEKDEWLNC